MERLIHARSSQVDPQFAGFTRVCQENTRVCKKIQEFAGFTRVCQENTRVCWVYKSLPRTYKSLLGLQEKNPTTKQASNIQNKHPKYKIFLKQIEKFTKWVETAPNQLLTIDSGTSRRRLQF